MRTEWTAPLLERVREHAAQGYSMRETAALLELKLSSLMSQASIHKIKFRGKPGPAGGQITRMARAQRKLAREIRAAKIQAIIAPLYRDGP